MDPSISILLSLSLIMASALFSLFDSALGSCRKSRLEKERSLRYKAVLKALENPLKLSLACRLWINILRVLAAFFGGLFIVNLYSSKKESIILAALVALYALILGIVITLLTDALPKLFSQTKPEKITAALLPLIKVLSVPMIPFNFPAIKFASFFKTAIHPEINENGITEEQLQDELRHTLIEGEKSGIVESKERSMVEGVFYLGDRPVAAFMTHRSEIQWFDINAPYDEIREKALEHRSQRCFPVVDGSPDDVAGVVYLEDIILVSQDASSNNKALRAIMKKAQFVPETMTALKAFESFKEGQVDFLFVMDEYGGLAGIISIRDLVEEIVGELSAPVASEQPLIRQEDGSYLADGTLNIDDAVRELSLTGLPEEDEFHTLAGFVLHLAGELPAVGDSYEYQGYVFTVKEMDGNRIGKIEVRQMRNEE